MHFSKALHLLAAISAARAVASPIDLWPFNNGDDDDPECKKEWDEEGVSNTWSMIFYGKANCGDEVQRLDSTTVELGKCQKIDKGVRSFQAIAHGRYIIQTYLRPDCSWPEDTFQYDLPNVVTDLKEEDAPRSFTVYPSKDHGPFPRDVFCALPPESDVAHGVQAQHTLEICSAVREKCAAAKTAFECPSEEEFYQEYPAVDEVRCRLENLQMQSFFDELCRPGGNGTDTRYSCQRAVPEKSEGGSNFHDVDCYDAPGAIEDPSTSFGPAPTASPVERWTSVWTSQKTEATPI